MIPRAHVTAWRRDAPWPTDAQVEQDLVISRALVEMFSEPLVAESVAFRGGTALHKLFVQPPGRYSEDVDLVQVEARPIGAVLDALRSTLDPWLGEPRRKRGHGRVILLYRFESTSQPVQRMRLKLEINSREHFSVLGMEKRRFDVSSPWFSASASILTYDLDELLGTKLRALYQRKKGAGISSTSGGPHGTARSTSTASSVAFVSISSTEVIASPAPSSRPTWCRRCAIQRSLRTSALSWRPESTGTSPRRPDWSSTSSYRVSKASRGRVRADRAMTMASDPVSWSALTPKHAARGAYMLRCLIRSPTTLGREPTGAR